MSPPGVGKNLSISVFSLYISKLFPPPPPPLPPPPEELTPPNNMSPRSTTTPPNNMPPVINRLRLNFFEQKCVTTSGR